MITLQGLRTAILDQIPPPDRFDQEDAEVVRRNRDLLLSWSDRIVQNHYNKLYAYEPTRKIFHEGERERLEVLLANWWRRIINGPIDDKFWDWMVLVGLAHIRRRVSNTLMLTSWGNILNFAVLEIQMEVLKGTLEIDEATQLTTALVKLGKTFTSLIAESYLHGLAEATGTNFALLENLAAYELDTVIGQLREELKQ